MSTPEFRLLTKRIGITARHCSPGLNVHEQEEIASDTFASFPKADWLEASSSFPFIIAVVRNRVSDFYRRKNRLTRLKRVSLEAPVPHLDALECVSKEERIAQIRSCVSKLSPLQQAIIFNRFYNGRSFREIANYLGKPKSTIARECICALAILRMLIPK